MFGDLFPQPKKLVFKDSLFQCSKVMSLTDGLKKMSKSDKSEKSCINLTDDSESIRLKIRKAKTDSEGIITYDPVNRPEVANLLRIYAALDGIPAEKAHQVFRGDNMFAFKEKLSNKIIDRICPIGDRALEFSTKKEDMLLEIIDNGAKEANKIAESKLI